MLWISFIFLSMYLPSSLIFKYFKYSSNKECEYFSSGLELITPSQSPVFKLVVCSSSNIFDLSNALSNSFLLYWIHLYHTDLVVGLFYFN